MSNPRCVHCGQTESEHGAKLANGKPTCSLTALRTRYPVPGTFPGNKYPTFEPEAP